MAERYPKLNFATSIVEKEEKFLIEMKNKCIEQLNHLKVEELALQSLLASSDQQPATPQAPQESYTDISNNTTTRKS